MSNLDKAGVEYWDQVWDGSELPAAIDPHDSSATNHAALRFHTYFAEIFEELNTTEMSLLEIGCAKSAWLPYFAQQYGFEVWGLDYSEIGCEQSRQILENEQVEGTIVLGDAFDPPEAMLARFDVVVSFGVLEHFADTAATLSSFAQFLKPNGILLTAIPNMTGVIGRLQKLLNRPVFDIHVPLDAPKLRQAHEKAGLAIMNVSYIVFLNLWVVSLQGMPSTSWKYRLVRATRAILGRLVRLFTRMGGGSVTQKTSSYVVCAARVL